NPFPYTRSHSGQTHSVTNLFTNCCKRPCRRGCVRPSHHRGANVRGSVRLVTSRATFVDSESTRKLEVTRRHDVVDEVTIPGLPGTMPEVLVVVSGPVSYRQPSCYAGRPSPRSSTVRTSP